MIKLMDGKAKVKAKSPDTLIEFLRRHGSEERFEPSKGLAPNATGSKCGSNEKIAVLCWRLENGYELWHPHDSKQIDLRHEHARQTDCLLRVSQKKD